MDEMLNDLSVAMPARRECLTRLIEHGSRRLKTNTLTKRSIADKYRAERRQLEELFAVALPFGHPLEPGVQALTRRSQRIRPIAAELNELADSGKLPWGLSALCGSYLHMQANRFLRGAANEHEFVLCEFLLRIYESRAARDRSSA